MLFALGGVWTPSQGRGKLRLMPARSPSRRRALTWWLALTPIVPLLSGACVTIPDNFDEPEAAAVAPSTARELLERHIVASGGEEALRALAQRTVEARLVFEPQEGCEEGSQDCVWEQKIGQFVLHTTADGRMYRRMVVDDNIIERGFDGGTGWQMQAQPQMLIVEDPSLEFVLREDALLHWYLDIEQREQLALELLPARDGPDGSELDGLVWIPATEAMPQSEKWFDRSTGLLHEEVERDTARGDLVRRIYSDYRDVDGVQVPWLIRQITEVEGYADQVVELRVQVVHHRDVREELFAVPELAPVEPVPDELLTVLDQAKIAAAESPKDVIAQVTHARIAFAAVHFEEATEASKRALALDKDEIEAIYILARIALLRGELREAEKLLRQALAKGLRPNEVARQLAWIHMRTGEWNKAGKELGEAGSPELSARYEAFSGKPLDAKMKGCTTTVPIEVDTGAVVVEVNADGDKLRMLFDTSASDLIISDSRAHSLVIGTDAESPLAAGGPPLRQGQLDNLAIGELQVANVPVTMIPDDQIASVVGMNGIDGVLGIRAFAERQITIDRSAKTLEIVNDGRKCAKQREERRVGASMPFLVHETHYLYVLAHMNEAEGLYLLNTGMRGADLTANEAAYAYAGIGAPSMRGNAPSLARVERFALGEFERKDLGAAWGFMQQNATSDNFRLDGMLGLGALGLGRWTLDYEQQRMYISAPPPPAEAPAEAPPSK